MPKLSGLRPTLLYICHLVPSVAPFEFHSLLAACVSLFAFVILNGHPSPLFPVTVCTHQNLRYYLPPLFQQAIAGVPRFN